MKKFESDDYFNKKIIVLNSKNKNVIQYRHKIDENSYFKNIIFITLVLMVFINIANIAMHIIGGIIE